MVHRHGSYQARLATLDRRRLRSLEHRDGRLQLRRAPAGLLGGGPPAGTRWLVVDNDSTDDSASLAEDLGATVIRLSRNVGFSAANNAGLEKVVTPWVAFVNPDVRVGPAEDLARLARVATANRGLVAPQLLNPDGTAQPNGRGLPFPLSKIAHRSRYVPRAHLDGYTRTNLSSPTFVAWVMGAAFSGRTEDFRRLGGWDERYFLYYEDHDLGLRAWAAGLPVIVDPSVRWTHDWQRATKRLRLAPWRHELRSGAKFYRKYPALISRRRASKVPLLADIQGAAWRPALDVSPEFLG